jgi:hypothetical protein
LRVLRQLLKKAGISEADITDAITSIRTMDEVAPIHSETEYRAYAERWHKMAQIAPKAADEYMDYTRTAAGRLMIAIFNRMREWEGVTNG